MVGGAHRPEERRRKVAASTLALPILDEQPSPALERPVVARPPWWRSGPVLLGVGGLLAVILAMAGMVATGAVAVERDQQSGRADLAVANVSALAAQMGAACDSGAVAPTPVSEPACRSARAVLSDPTTRLGDDARVLLDTLRGIAAARPPGAPRLDPAQVLAAGARNPTLRAVGAGDLERAARAAVAAEQGAVSDRDAADAADPVDPVDPPRPVARDVRFVRDDRGCQALISYSDGSTERVPADPSSCGPPPAPDDPPLTTITPDPSSSAPTETTPPETSSTDPTPGSSSAPTTTG